mmetsp:Transcript_12815/g.38786  ORF Transcript_12815/g.38786 Transcript_12815/m.38786 type:complete len:482 (+) Transcript_12815:266-1711(+)
MNPTTCAYSPLHSSFESALVSSLLDTEFPSELDALLDAPLHPFTSSTSSTFPKSSPPNIEIPVFQPFLDENLVSNDASSFLAAWDSAPVRADPETHGVWLPSHSTLPESTYLGQPAATTSTALTTASSAHTPTSLDHTSISAHLQAYMREAELAASTCHTGADIKPDIKPLLPGLSASSAIAVTTPGASEQRIPLEHKPTLLRAPAAATSASSSPTPTATATTTTVAITTMPSVYAPLPQHLLESSFEVNPNIVWVNAAHASSSTSSSRQLSPRQNEAHSSAAGSSALLPTLVQHRAASQNDAHMTAEQASFRDAVLSAVSAHLRSYPASASSSPTPLSAPLGSLGEKRVRSDHVASEEESSSSSRARTNANARSEATPPVSSLPWETEEHPYREMTGCLVLACNCGECVDQPAACGSAFSSADSLLAAASAVSDPHSLRWYDQTDKVSSTYRQRQREDSFEGAYERRVGQNLLAHWKYTP